MKNGKTEIIGSWLRNRTEVVLIIFLGFYTLFHGGHNERFITGDGKGYYAHLPALVIYHDWDYRFMENYESTYYEPANYAEFRNQVGDEWVNKYFAGVTLLMMPFFLLAHLVSLVSGLPADGYNPVYQYAVAFTALFWLWAGLFFLGLFLNRQKIPALITSIVQVLIVCATPLFVYTPFLLILLFGLIVLIKQKKRDDLRTTGFCRIPAVLCLAHGYFICGSSKEGFLFIGWDLIFNHVIKFCADKSASEVYSSLEHYEQRKILESISQDRHPVARTFMEMA